jgi:hypothetical protein
MFEVRSQFELLKLVNEGGTCQMRELRFSRMIKCKRLTIEVDIKLFDVGRVAEDDRELQVRFRVLGSVFGFVLLQRREEALLVFVLARFRHLSRQ